MRAVRTLPSLRLMIFGVILLVLLIPPSIVETTQSILNDLFDDITSQGKWRENTGYVDEISFIAFQSDNDEILALKRGLIDIIGHSVSRQYIMEDKTLLTNPNIQLGKTPSRSFGLLSFDTQKFPTSSRALRQAFAWALDKNKIQEDVFANYSRPADSLIVPGVGYWSIEHPNATYAQYGIQKPPTYYAPNVQEGNLTLLEESFYDIDGDGYREYYNGTDSPFNLRSFLKVQGIDDATAANMKGKIPLQTYGGLPSDFTNDTSVWVDDDKIVLKIMMYQGKLFSYVKSAFLSLGINVSPVDPPPSWFLLPISEPFNSSNAIFFSFTLLKPTPLFLKLLMSNRPLNKELWHWSNSTYDSLVETILTSSNLTEVEEANYRAQVILWEEQPLVVLYNNFLLSLYRTSKLDGWITETGVGTNSYWSWVKVYPKGQRKLGNKLVQSIHSFGSFNIWESYGPESPILQLIYDTLWKWTPDDLKPIGWLADSMNFGRIVKKTLTFKAKNPITDTPINYTKIVLVNGTVLKNHVFKQDTTLDVLVQELSFKLHPNLVFHDQVNLTSADVKFTFQLIRKTQSFNYLQYLVDEGGSIDPDWIETPDNLTVKIYSLSHSYFEYLNTLVPIHPKHIWDKFKNPSLYSNSVPVGSGPYKWKSSVAQKYYVLERNPNWPFLPKISNKSSQIRDEEAIYQGSEDIFRLIGFLFLVETIVIAIPLFFVAAIYAVNEIIEKLEKKPSFLSN